VYRILFIIKLGIISNFGIVLFVKPEESAGNSV
jgi:hypothetical protein